MDGPPVIVWGARGHGLVVHELLEARGSRVAAFADNDPTVRSPVEGLEVVHGLDALGRHLGDSAGAHGFVVAIGGERGRDRLALHDALSALGLEPVTLVHPSATVASSVALGSGCQVLAGAIVSAGARIGRQCIVNTGAIVDHECELGDGVHVAPGAVLAGCVRIEPSAMIGAGAVVLPRTVVGEGAVVGAGAVVTAAVEPGGVVAGVPARVVGSRRT